MYERKIQRLPKNASYFTDKWERVESLTVDNENRKVSKEEKKWKNTEKKNNKSNKQTQSVPRFIL